MAYHKRTLEPYFKKDCEYDYDYYYDGHTTVA